MARPRQFDEETALDAAIGVFGTQGYAGASAGDLTRAMGIGRQSLYDTYGDKWQLYLAALRRYTAQDNEGHLAALSTGPRAADGLEILLARVRAKAGEPCLAVSAVAEFGRSRAEVTAILAEAGKVLRAALVARLLDAQEEGDVAGVLDAEEGAAFLAASIDALRLAARGGAGAEPLQTLAEMTLRALR